MKVLFLSPVPIEGAGCRARIVQYIPYLQAAGIESAVRPFMDERFFRIAYLPGCWGRKACYFLLSLLRRVMNCVESVRYDVIYIYRECAPLGPPVFEWVLERLGKPIIYDLDDAIHLPSEQEWFRGSLWRWLKWYSKVSWILRCCDCAVVGNRYLQVYAQQFAPLVVMLSTPEDPARFNSRFQAPPSERPVIGWIGTHSTSRYLEQLRGVFQALAQRYDFDVYVVGAGRPITIPSVRVTNIPWILAQEARTVQRFDIGVYPLSGSLFDQGKACYKAILYMAAGVPVVASNYGANQDIIQDGVNGFLVSSQREWVERLAQLLQDATLRARLVEQGRRTVMARYSVAVNAPTLIRVLRSVNETQRRTGA